MQKITQKMLIDKAVSLLDNGTVTKVLGWMEGQFKYDVSPFIFKSKEDIESLKTFLN